MSESSEGQGRPVSRQSQAEELARQAREIPEVAEAMDAYARLQLEALSRVISVPARVTYATGGNA